MQKVRTSSKVLSTPEPLVTIASIMFLLIFAYPVAAWQQAPADGSDCVHIVVRRADIASAKENSRKNGFVSLPEIARRTMNNYFGKGHPSEGIVEQAPSDWVDTIKVEPRFLKPAGVFVTLSKNGKTRACWGSVDAREANIAKETVISTLGALSKDYRFRPISKVELKNLKVQVTVVRGLEAVSSVKMIDPLKDGIMVRAGGRSGVILPGEAVDSYYEFVLARLKAGIKPNDPCQIYKIRAEIYD